MKVKYNQLFLNSIIFLFILFPSWESARKKEASQGIDIVFIGNSISYGVSLKNPQEEAPPVIACKYIQSKCRTADVGFYNNGKNGFTTVDFLPSGKAFSNLVEAATHLHQDKRRLLVFSIALGTNDSALEGTSGAPVSPVNYFRNMQSIIDQLLIIFPDSKFILQRPIWYSPNTQNNSRYLEKGLERLQTYFPQLNSLVKHYSKSNPAHVFSGDQKGFDYFRKNYLTDLTPEEGKQGVFYLHPNKKGATVLGKLWGKAIYRNLRIYLN